MLNVKQYTNNIFGSDDEAIKNNCYFETQIVERIKALICNGIRSFAIYPMGNWGMYIYRLLRDIYRIENIICVDDDISSFSTDIYSFEQYVAGKYTNMLLISSNEVEDYSAIRERVGKCIEASLYIDLFPIKPLYKRDSRLISLEFASREVYRYGIAGNVAEVGVYRGYFAEYINHFFYDRTFYLFDTFCGFDKRDIEIEKANNYSQFEPNTDFLDTTEAIVMDKMEHPELCKCIRGWFPESIKLVPETTYCFVHLDTDLYMPTLNGLKYFWPRLEKGGYIFVHDFNGIAQGVRSAVVEFCKDNNVGYVCLPDSALKGTAVITK